MTIAVSDVEDNSDDEDIDKDNHQEVENDGGEDRVEDKDGMYKL